MEPSDKKLLNAFLACTFLGMFGLHRIYLGKVGTGLVMFFLTVTFLGAFVTAVWTLIDWITLLSGAFRDGDGRKVTQWT